MVVAAAGRPGLRRFILGILCAVFAFSLLLYLYSYTSGLTSYGYTILNSSDVLPLFLFIAALMLLGVYGGYEIGRFAEISHKNKTLSQKKQ